MRGLALALCLALATADLAGADEPQPTGVAVMPFGGEDSLTAAPLAERLAERMAARTSLRVVPPSKTGAAAVSTLDAAQVRSWAELLAVQSILLGSVDPDGDAQSVEVGLRSGHSGGPMASHRVRMQGVGDFDRAVDELADALLADLGAPAAAPLPGVGAPASQASAEVDVQDDEADGDKGLFSVGAGDEPLSIDSEELELTEQGENRHLIFRRNVRVTQGDIQLLTEKLEAFYEAGSSQPERLVATGRVRVVQGERRARCDRAVYQRSDQTVVCTGRAELVQQCDRVRGPKIQFDLDRDHVRVLGGASVVIVPDSADGSGCATSELGS
jgi:lipopolysaccharide export system protein LptA